MYHKQIEELEILLADTPVEGPKYHTLTVRLSEKHYSQLKRRAALSHKTLAAVVRDALGRYLP